MNRYINSFHKKMRDFLTNTRGGIGIVFASCLVPMVTISVGSTMVTDSVGSYTRLHQSVVAASLAITKEGENPNFAQRQEMAETWVRGNMAALEQPENVRKVTLNSEFDSDSISVVYEPSIGMELPGLEALSSPFRDAPVVSERIYDPLELVIVIDGSGSQNNNIPHIRAAVTTLLDGFFLQQPTADDVYVSLIAYSGYMNIGKEYADKLVTTESRKLPGVDTPFITTERVKGSWCYPNENWDWCFYDVIKNLPKKQSIYDKQVATLEAVNPALVEDILAPGGPGSKWGIVCVERPPFPNNNPDQYAIDIEEEAPVDPDDGRGFKLIMADGRYATYAGKWGPAEMGYTQPENSVRKGHPLFGTADITEIAIIPESEIKESERKDPEKYGQWKWKDFKESSVGMFTDCNSMPILIGVNSQAEILERFELFGGGYMTGGDEGLAWALRALSPDWENIWEKGPDFPADFTDEKTEKRLILYIGADLGDGYNGVAQYGSNFNAVTPICKRLKDNGVDVTVVVDENENLDSFALAAYGTCTADGVFVGTPETILEHLDDIAKRKYKVALKN